VRKVQLLLWDCFANVRKAILEESIAKLIHFCGVDAKNSIAVGLHCERSQSSIAAVGSLCERSQSHP
jgi:hypothetical protein